MADLKILTAASPAASLSYGRLAVSAGNLYFGNVSNVPVRVSNHGHTHISSDITDLATYYSQVGHGHSVSAITDIADHYTPKFKGITVVSASRNLAASDVNCILHVTGGYTLTIPAGVFTAGSEITIVRTGSSNVILLAGSGVSINGVSTGSVTITTQYKSVVLRCYSNTVFYVEPVDSAYAAVGQTFYLGTTQIAINRASAAIVLTGITSIDGSAATLTTARTLTIGATGKTFNGGANVSWSLDEIGASPKRATVTTVSASRNLAIGDVNAVLFVTGTYTLTIPANTFTAGDQITIVRTGATTVTITAGAGVTLNGVSAGSTTITTAYKMVTLVFQSANEVGGV